MNLASRLLLLLLIAAVPVLVIQLARETRARGERAAEIATSAEAYAGLMAARTDRFIDGARILLASASRVGSVRTLDESQCSTELAHILSALPEFPAVAAFDVRGDAHCLSDPNRPRVNIADRTYFQDTLSLKRFLVSDYVVGRQSGNGTIAFTYPVLDDSDVVVAVTLMFINTTPLSALLNSPPIPAGAFAALVDSTGTIAARWPDPEAWVGRPAKDAAFGRAVLEGAGRGINATLEDGKDYAIGFAALSDPIPMDLVVGLPLTPALLESQAEFSTVTLLTLTAFLAAGLAALLLGRQWITRPVIALRETADAMARGNLAARPADRSPVPEIDALRQHIVAMAQALDLRMHQKDALLKEVNHRVKNSLQLVSSLLSLHRGTIEDPAARRQFEDVAAKIATVARVHQRLYRDEDVESLDFGAFLGEMCRELSGRGPDGGRAEIACDADEHRLPTDIAIPLALVINELVTTAVAHARSVTVGPTRVHLRFKRDGDAVIASIVGGGAAGSGSMQPGRPSGSRLIQALLRQLRGTLDVTDREFIVRVPA